MKDLQDIFTTSGLLADRNGDGLADELAVEFFLQPGVIVTGLIDFCARLGLETSELDLPTIHVGGSLADDKHPSERCQVVLRLEPSLGDGDAVCNREAQQNKILFRGGSPKALDELLRWMAAYWPHAVSAAGPVDHIYLIGGNRIKLTGNGEERQTIFIQWPAADFTAAPTVQRPRPLASLTDLWTPAGFYQAGRVDLTSRTDIFFTGAITTETLNIAAARLAARIGLASTGVRFPLTGEAGRIPELTFAFQAATTEAEEIHCRVEFCAHPEEPSARIITFTGGEKVQAVAVEYLAAAVPGQEGGQFGCWEREMLDRFATPSETHDSDELITQRWEDRGEKADMEKLFQEALEQAVQSNRANPDLSGQRLRFAVCAFLSEPAEVRRELKARWERETQAQLGGECEIIIHSAFKPGFCWVKESVIPAVKASGRQVARVLLSFQPERRDDGLELPHRWLQEWYPVDQLLERELELPLEQIEFKMNEQLATTYQIEMWDQQGQTIGVWQLQVPVLAVPYLDGKKKAYPTTSAFYADFNGRRISEQILPTDRARFWFYYTQEFLPMLKERLADEALGDRRRGVEIPLFYALDVHVTMSEQEEKLGIDEERLSALEALHEDIYFYTLDYFAEEGKKLCGVEWNAPGAVRPFITARSGATPSAKIRVRCYHHREVPVIRTASLSFTEEAAEPIAATVLFGDGDPADRVEWRRSEAAASNEDIPAELEKWGLAEWGKLTRDPSVFLWRVARSFEKRAIFAVEVTAPRISQFVSRHKFSLHKPTFLIETGHHPNEVSSMPAARELVSEIVTTHREWLRHFNLVVIPCANVDGYALHRELTRDNPEWKHHAARYNAVGLEFTTHRFRQTIFGEASVLPTLFYRWLPDIVLDDHGIPSHEWTQPFGGYNSPPRFPVSYWVPISLIYGIGRELERDRYPHHVAALDEVQKAIAKRIGEHQHISRINKHYRDRYIRYGHNWHPELFPIEGEQDLLFYRWPTKPDEHASSLLARHPEWCTLDLISETADETVYGEALRDCIQAHNLFHLGIIDWLLSRSIEVRRSFADMTIQLTRGRPLKGREQQ